MRLYMDSLKHSINIFKDTVKMVYGRLSPVLVWQFRFPATLIHIKTWFTLNHK
jgi:hypothetical protein